MDAEREEFKKRGAVLGPSANKHPARTDFSGAENPLDYKKDLLSTNL